MRTPFESVTRAALEEIVKNHAKMSKFGYILSPEELSELLDDLYNFVQTSRSLKAAGDKLLTLGPPTKKGPGARTTLR